MLRQLLRSKRDRQAGRRKGQALVEMAMMGTLLGMLLAGAVDLGRAYYTTVVVTSMAGEGAAYAAINPDKDASSGYRTAGSCGRFAVVDYDNIQDRARRVANERGLVIHSPNQVDISITPADCTLRCGGNPITVQVTYRIDDLLIPGLLGLRNITIRRAASQVMVQSAFAATANCP